MKHGIASKKGHTINYKRYFLASNIGSKSIFNNIIGVIKTMLNKINIQRLWVYSKMWLKGVKDIKWLNAYKKTINSIDKNVIKNVLKIANHTNRLEILTKRIDDNYDKLDNKIDDVENDLNDYSISQDKKIKDIVCIMKQDDQIKALENDIKIGREDYESLKTFHNNLAMEYRDNSASKTELKVLEDKINLLINNDINDKESESKFKLSYKLTNNDLETALSEIIYDINEGIKYGSLRGINSHEKELRAIVEKYIHLSN